MIPEADVVNGVPQAAGWFVVNARVSPWFHNELGGYCGFEGRDDAAFDDLGVDGAILQSVAHAESGQEGFLVLRGECLLVVEGEERPLRAWDFFHCPPHTKHVIIGAGREPALVLAVGARKGVASYPVDATAMRHGAGVDRGDLPPAEAYAKFSKPEQGPAPELR